MDSTRQTIVEEWQEVKLPPPPELSPVVVDAASTALLILDIQRTNCNPETRPRCVATIPHIRQLLDEARRCGMLVVYSLTRGAGVGDICGDLAPRPGEPVVQASVDKFFRTEMETILQSGKVETVIVTGTAAHGAVLHTATGAAMRGLKVVVPVDCMSADNPYAEQYTAWHMVNAPGTRRQAVITRSEMITIRC
jgi:nicotinamidase-related amidase